MCQHGNGNDGGADVDDSGDDVDATVGCGNSLTNDGGDDGDHG